MNNSDRLFLYLNEKLQDTIDFEDILNLFFSLYCTIDILPKNMQSIVITKETLAEIFVKITKSKYKFKSNIDNNSLNNGFWIDLINEYLKKGVQPNLSKAKILLDNDTD